MQMLQLCGTFSLLTTKSVHWVIFCEHSICTRAHNALLCMSIVKIPKQCTMLTFHCHILFGTLCEVLHTLPSFGGDLAFILSREDSCYCQGVYISGQLSVDQWMRQGVDVVIRELCPISCPGDVSGRAICGSAGENECWLIHWCPHKGEWDNHWWLLKDSWKRL